MSNFYGFGRPGQPPYQGLSYPVLVGREVSGIDEAKAAQINVMAGRHYFIDRAAQKIYVRYLGDDGLFALETYALQPPEPEPPAQDNEFAEIRAKIARLEERINEFGGNLNAQQPPATIRNPSKRQSNGSASADGGE